MRARWATLFRVGYTDTSYAISSYGADKVQSFTGTSIPQVVTTNNFDCDIIISEGNFVVYPDGVQNQ